MLIKCLSKRFARKVLTTHWAGEKSLVSHQTTGVVGAKEEPSECHDAIRSAQGSSKPLLAPILSEA